MRYFIETSYKGTAYSGFQVQQNSNTIQAEIEKALFFILSSLLRLPVPQGRMQAYMHCKIIFISMRAEINQQSEGEENVTGI